MFYESYAVWQHWVAGILHPILFALHWLAFRFLHIVADIIFIKRVYTLYLRNHDTSRTILR